MFKSFAQFIEDYRELGGTESDHEVTAQLIHFPHHRKSIKFHWISLPSIRGDDRLRLVLFYGNFTDLYRARFWVDAKVVAAGDVCVLLDDFFIEPIYFHFKIRA